METPKHRTTEKDFKITIIFVLNFEQNVLTVWVHIFKYEYASSHVILSVFCINWNSIQGLSAKERTLTMI